VVFDEVTEHVEARLARGRERHGPGDEPPPARGGDVGEERAAEGVVLERAVPGGAEHGARATAVGLAVVADQKALAAVAFDAAVADLIAADGGLQPRAAPGAPAQQLVGGERG
jgi:hypothetical protein